MVSNMTDSENKSLAQSKPQGGRLLIQLLIIQHICINFRCDPWKNYRLNIKGTLGNSLNPASLVIQMLESENTTVQKSQPMRGGFYRIKLWKEINITGANVVRCNTD